MPQESVNIIKYFLLITVLLILFTFSYFSYSTDGYTFVKYPGVAGSVKVCIEGETDPTNQTITIINDGATPTSNPRIEINGIVHIFNYTVDDKGIRQRTDALKLGCNNMIYGSDSDTRFKVKIGYMSHWRPQVKALEMGNLIAGHSTRYFVSTEDADTRKIVLSRLNITDISRDSDKLPKYDLEFNGTAVKYSLEQPGNYKAAIQVYDGYVWSDIYEAGYTVHVIQTDEVRKAHRIIEVEDDPIRETQGYVPVAIKPDDNEAVKIAKRAVDGGYILAKRAVDFARGTYFGLRN